MQRLVPIAEGAGVSLRHLALAWVLRRSEVASPITGASRPEQIHANTAASNSATTCSKPPTRHSVACR